jgi:periplasmic divalent cation tolerance protein
MQADVQAIIVFVTCGSLDEAEQLAETLVRERLAACVNVASPVTSIYRWQGALQRDQEWLLIIKSAAAVFASLEARVRELHSYDTPEVIAVPIVAGSAAYLDWLWTAVDGTQD